MIWELPLHPSGWINLIKDSYSLLQTAETKVETKIETKVETKAKTQVETKVESTFEQKNVDFFIERIIFFPKNFSERLFFEKNIRFFFD